MKGSWGPLEREVGVTLTVQSTETRITETQSTGTLSSTKLQIKRVLSVGVDPGFTTATTGIAAIVERPDGCLAVAFGERALVAGFGGEGTKAAAEHKAAEIARSWGREVAPHYGRRPIPSSDTAWTTRYQDALLGLLARELPVGVDAPSTVVPPSYSSPAFRGPRGFRVTEILAAAHTGWPARTMSSNAEPIAHRHARMAEVAVTADSHGPGGGCTYEVHPRFGWASLGVSGHPKPRPGDPELASHREVRDQQARLLVDVLGLRGSRRSRALQACHNDAGWDRVDAWLCAYVALLAAIDADGLHQLVLPPPSEYAEEIARTGWIWVPQDASVADRLPELVAQLPDDFGVQVV